MEDGDLHHYIVEQGDKLRNNDRFSYISQILKAMVYLSHLQILHRDLVTRNCLLKSNYKILKISDFGLSHKTDFNNEYYLNYNVPVPARWLPMEVYNSERPLFTTKTDVWAFGVTVWEIFSKGAMPYSDIFSPSIPLTENKMKEFMEHLEAGHRLDRPNVCPNEVYEIMRTCWDEDPNNRPSFETLQMQFNRIEVEFNTEYLEPKKTGQFVNV